MEFERPLERLGFEISLLSETYIMIEIAETNGLRFVDGGICELVTET